MQKYALSNAKYKEKQYQSHSRKLTKLTQRQGGCKQTAKREA